MILHGYFRSTASYRVRLALNLKGLPFENVFHHLRKYEQRAPAFLALNPQGLVPALQLGAQVLTQSLAICEYLDETHPQPPLLPASPLERARVRAAAQVIACDVHPIQNLKVLDRLRENGLGEEAVKAWARTTIEEGLEAFSALLPEGAGPFCFGDAPGLADIFLIPQLVNARRFGAEIALPRILEIETACLELDAFRRSRPDVQPDAE
ncbi:maleylacetoacetate isomerase [Novosphingobium sp. B 225]|uniref:maleylacetoacetate isomerase n=1 Tax=Novosphingobium sp. B 225 TaxID=1961849 RepID=UPI000B4ADAF5|nr:maleylacetoacetate isomerase [Novosphingobium sp. B 225]